MIGDGDTPSLPGADFSPPVCGPGLAIFDSSTPVAEPATRVAEPAMPVDAVQTGPDESATPVDTVATPVDEPATPVFAVPTRPDESATGMAQPATGVAGVATGAGKPATAVARDARVQNQDATAAADGSRRISRPPQIRISADGDRPRSVRHRSRLRGARLAHSPGSSLLHRAADSFLQLGALWGVEWGCCTLPLILLTTPHRLRRRNRGGVVWRGGHCSRSRWEWVCSSH